MILAQHGKILSTFHLPIELTNGNEGRTKSWYKPAKARKEYLSIIRSEFEAISITAFRSPVFVHVTRIIPKGGRFWDSSSCGRGNYKEIEDALVEFGMFKDDNTKHIINTFFFQNDKLRPEIGKIAIDIWEAKTTKGGSQ